MTRARSTDGFTVLELVAAIAIIGILSGIYFFLLDSYRERSMNEKAAKALLLAAKVQEDFFAKEKHYFDAEVSGGGGDAVLATPDGRKTDVRVPPNVVLILKSKGKDKPAFTGHAFYTGSKVLHQYDSDTGKMATVARGRDD